MAASAPESVSPANVEPGLLPWQQSLWSRTVGWARQGRLPHAILISGQQGCGKRRFAEQLAMWLLCEQRQERDRPCSECRQCLLWLAGSHPDIRIFRPEEKSRYIRVDQIRSLSEFVSQSPQVAHGKVVIIDAADHLNINAANALLKTLEEPAEDVTLIMLHHSGNSLLPTLVSRCQSLLMPRPDGDEALHWLRRHWQDADRETDASADVENALALAGQAPLLALTYLQNGVPALRSACLTALQAFLKGQRTLSEASAPFVKSGLEQSLDIMSRWVHDLARLQGGGTGLDQGAHDMLSYLATHNHPVEAHRLHQELNSVRESLDNNVNAEMAIERLLLAWKALMPQRKRA